MKRVYKYPINPLQAAVTMRKGAQILCVQMQGGFPYVWALVDPLEAQMTRRFRVVGTGHDLPDDPGEYVGTFQPGNGLVLHLFVIPECEVQ